MPTTWIVIADETVARFINAKSLNDLDEIARFDHPAGRMHNGDLISDKAGRSYESTGTTRHAIDPQTTPKEVESEIFARMIVDHLEKARNQGKVDRIYLVAPAGFLGTIRSLMRPPLEGLVVEGVAKQLTTVKPEKIKDHLYITFGA